MDYRKLLLHASCCVLASSKVTGPSLLHLRSSKQDVSVIKKLSFFFLFKELKTCTWNVNMPLEHFHMCILICWGCILKYSFKRWSWETSSGGDTRKPPYHSFYCWQLCASGPKWIMESLISLQKMSFIVCNYLITCFHLRTSNKSRL